MLISAAYRRGVPSFALAWAAGLLLAVLTVVFSLVEDLPIRDPDNLIPATSASRRSSSARSRWTSSTARAAGGRDAPAPGGSAGWAPTSGRC